MFGSEMARHGLGVRRFVVLEFVEPDGEGLAQATGKLSKSTGC